MGKIQVAKYLLDVLDTIKLFHWTAENYDLHIISGNLHDSLEPEIDAIMEGLMISKKIPDPPNKTSRSFLDTLSTLEEFLESIKEKRVRANIDNSLQIIGKFLYLYRMKLRF